MMIVHTIIGSLLTAAIFQQLTLASPKEGTNNQTVEHPMTIPEPHSKDNTTESQPLALKPEEPPAHDVQELTVRYWATLTLVERILDLSITGWAIAGDIVQQR
jgi:hypothetical protein